MRIIFHVFINEEFNGAFFRLSRTYSSDVVGSSLFFLFFQTGIGIQLYTILYSTCDTVDTGMNMSDGIVEVKYFVKRFISYFYYQLNSFINIHSVQFAVYFI
uniref:Uncharacterized protein n=1 Tax=Cacopsylla melanoneura TaxID=428564 RepID=A0A8D9BBI6_9HEMI